VQPCVDRRLVVEYISLRVWPAVVLRFFDVFIRMEGGSSLFDVNDNFCG
jgi:hypothetical protein